MKEINIPDSVRYIDEETFAYCHDLKQVKIGKNVKKIGDGAFQSSGLTEICLPDSVEVLGNAVFHSCGNLEKVEIGIGRGLKSIGVRVLDQCNNLKRVYIPSTYQGENRELLIKGLDIRDHVQIVEV